MVPNYITQYYGMMHVMAKVDTPDASLDPRDHGDDGDL